MENQKGNKTGLRYIEEELMSMNNNALQEEKDNVQRHYRYFQDKLDYLKAHVPFPDVHEDDKAIDYDDMINLNSMKRRNRENMEEQQKYLPFCTTGKLCCGHVKRGESDFFITQGKGLRSITLTDDRRNIMLIHTEDRRYQNILKQWRHPGDDQDVDYSRVIRMQNKEVQEVEVLLDRTNDTTIDVTDSFLKQALVRNKNNANITSIIETIQQQQDDIRLMPADASFVVQGCAGSGKTMILLHRLRYLLFNQEIKISEYVLLVPSNQFKEFIRDLAEEFEIYHRNIMPYTEYYQFALGQKAKHGEKNELLLPESMLSDVYSKEFIQTCYKNALNTVHNQNQDLLDYLEECLSGKLEEYSEALEEEITITQNHAIKDILDLIEPFAEYMQNNDLSSLEKVVAIRKEISQFIKVQEKLLEQKKSIRVEPVSESDERITNDSRVQSLENNLSREKQAYAKATIFSRGAHKRKVEQLSIQLDALKKELAQNLQRIAFREAYDGLEESPVFSVVSLIELENIYEKIGEIYSGSIQKIRKNREKLKNVEEEHIPQFLIKASNGFTELYDLMTMFDSVKDLYVQDVNSISAYLPEYIQRCSTCLGKINELLSEDVYRNTEKEKAPLFSLYSEHEIQNQFCGMLMIEANKIIIEKYQQVLDDSYKYYWYLMLYFTYLSKEVKGKLPHYIYIDESQDLSVSELELINKIHTAVGENGETDPPVINLFGDVNQTITDHGIKSWDEINFISSVFRLTENFRNTNQIVEYCNTKLLMLMKKVGVDMDKVEEYYELEEYIDNNRTLTPVYIVKDEKMRTKLQDKLSDSYEVSNTTVYTVKEVKGLEFKNVTVVMEGMTRNERYIAYTRALTGLSVVKEI